MGEIDFLSNPKEGTKKLKKEAVKDTKWTKPVVESELGAPSAINVPKKNGLSSFLSFFNSQSNKSLVNEGQVLRAREEVIKSIKTSPKKEDLSADAEFLDKLFNETVSFDNNNVGKVAKGKINKDDISSSALAVVSQEKDGASNMTPIKSNKIEPLIKSNNDGFFNRLVDRWHEFQKKRELDSLSKNDNKKNNLEKNKKIKEANLENKSEAEKADESHDVQEESENENNFEDAVLATNLMDEESAPSPRNWQEKIFFASTVFIVLIIVISFAYSALVVWKKQMEKTLEEKNKQVISLNKEIKEVEDELAKKNSLNINIALVENMQKKHIYWTNFFKYLEGIINKNVVLNGFSGGVGGDYGLGAKTVSFKAIMDQLKVLNDDKDHVIEAKTTAGTIVPGGEGKEATVDFSIAFKIKPDVFYNTSNPQVK